MTLALIIIAALLGASLLVTLIGSWVIALLCLPEGGRIDIGGSRQHVPDSTPAYQEPEGLPLVLLHGAGCNLQDMWLALGWRLIAARRRVIAVDRPGAGWSERRGRTSSSPAVQAAVLRDILDRRGVARAVLVGHSWGGALALAFALDYPQRTAGLVLLSPPTHPHLRRMSRLYRALAAPIFGWLFAHTLALPLAAAAFDAGIRAAFAPQLPPPDYLRRSAAFLLLRPAAFLANAQDMADLQGFLAQQAPRYRDLAVPTVIVQGDCDGIVPIERHAKALAAAAPCAKLVVLPGIGHMPHHVATDRVMAEIEDMSDERIMKQFETDQIRDKPVVVRRRSQWPAKVSKGFCCQGRESATFGGRRPLTTKSFRNTRPPLRSTAFSDREEQFVRNV